MSAPNKEAILDCTVHSELRYNVTWTRSSMESSVQAESGKLHMLLFFLYIYSTVMCVFLFCFELKRDFSTYWTVLNILTISIL